MKEKFFLLAILVTLNQLIYGQDTLKVDSKVEKVVVFLKGAQIKRKAACNLVKGRNQVNFTKISSQVNEKSILVKSDSSIVIQSVNFQVNYMDSCVRIEKINILQRSSDSIDNEKLVLENSLYVLKNEQELLNENQVLGGVKKTMKTEDLEKACEYYRNRLSEIVVLKNKTQNRLTQIETEKGRISNQLIELNQKKEKPVGEVMVLVIADESGTKDFNIEYFINDAGWTPKYDIRAESVNNPATLGYKADVYQNTDEDWTNAELILSSSNPSLGGTKPELKNWILNVNENYTQTNDLGDNSNYDNSVTYYDNLKNDYSKPISVDHEMTVTGRVVDGADNSALPGVNISIKGTSIGTVTNLEGVYTLKVPKGSQNIVFSFIGFVLMDLPITSTTVNCVMVEDATCVSEVVVIGYGTSRKKDLTGSVSILVNDGYGNFVSEGTLQGRTAGIQIRGMRSSRYKSPKKKIIGKTLSGLNTIKENQTSVEFKLDKPYTIPSDNKNYSVDIEKYEIPVHFQYSTVPKMEQSAFLLAELTGWEAFNLLSGAVNIYFEGSYIGSSNIDTQNINDTLDISMGRDKAIIIDRKLKEDFNNKHILKKGKTESYTWEITVKNTKNEKINITVEDQIPLTYSKNYEVELLESPDAKYDKSKGELSWNLELAPLEKKVLSFSYQVKIKNI